MSAKKSNHLAAESSPYLLQHAENPVDWYPWGPEALQKAHSEKRPILLSIGYSACHWCHVMAHESFEDAETAQVMNDLFINIKIDREERPDIDKIYQTAYQLLNRRAGGWPLTVFLTPDDQVPFFAATYLPKTARYGMPAFIDLMRRIISFYRQNEAEIRSQNDALMRYLNAEMTPQNEAASGELGTEPLMLAYTQLTSSFDEVNGGFGQAPKFPHPTNIERLLRHWRLSERSGKSEDGALRMACFSLEKMAYGGIYDQLGGGFCRYSVDAHWMIPHFEKMLYDNGPLLSLYSEAWAATGNILFQRIAEETAAWIVRDMQDPDGGYYSTLDADSEGEEGLFYVWDKSEIQALLAEHDYAEFASYFGLEKAPNFEGRWHFYITAPDEQVMTRLAGVRAVLRRERESRVWPARDEKILGAWNALAVKGMACAGRYLGRADFIDSAERALDFVAGTLWRDGRLLAVYKKTPDDHAGHRDKVRLPAYLDDYAFLLDAILEMLQARWNSRALQFAIALADILLARFQDQQTGGFYFTADDHERLIQRPKPVHDDALPAGNGIAAHALIRLGHLLGRIDYLDAAERTLRWAQPFMMQSPVACNALLLALEEYCYPGQCVILRGRPAALEPWRQVCQEGYFPRRLVLAIPDDAPDLPDLLAARKMSADESTSVTAYVCRGHECSPPLTDLTAVQTLLEQGF